MQKNIPLSINILNNLTKTAMAKKLYQMASSLILICFCLFCGCKGENKQVKGVENMNVVTNSIKNTFVLDSSVNSKLILDDYRSLGKFYSANSELKLIESLMECPIVAFCNTSKSEYLFAYQYEGNTQYAFSCFEIGYYDEIINDYTQTNYKDFGTESGLRLGLTLEEVESIKGKGYTKEGDKITYTISDPNTVFLRNHNMPEYFLECVLQQNKVVRIKFGFTYP